MKQLLTIRGMNCHHCTAAVKEALEEAGAVNVAVSLEDSTACCCSDMEEDTLRSILREEGFTLEKVEMLP
ncbi:MAG: heavy-metal-associated domain-containing protein [Oscillospiraceae bacterium]|nr:heavy-metal-associated domain-containing protein [Oscillospiraceae bacterium]